MRIRKINIYILFYRNIFNPLCWLLVLLAALQLCFLLWWKRKRDDKYYIYSIDKEGFKEYAREYVVYILSLFINTIWLHENRSKAYADFLKSL